MLHRIDEYFTLEEYYAAGGSLPEILPEMSSDFADQFADCFNARYAGRRIIQRKDEAPADGDSFHRALHRTAYGPAALELAQILEDKIRLRQQYVDDSETEKVEYKVGPNGGSSFPQAFTENGTIRTRQGGQSADPSRLSSVELVSLRWQFIDLFETAFLGVFDSWRAI